LLSCFEIRNVIFENENFRVNFVCLLPCSGIRIVICEDENVRVKKIIYISVCYQDQDPVMKILGCENENFNSG